MENNNYPDSVFIDIKAKETLMLTEISNLQESNKVMRELLEDLDAIIGTALHNGHHDLIARVKDVVRGRPQQTNSDVK